MTAVLLCHDDGPSIGLGHRRRMQVLGKELEGRGASVSLFPLTSRDWPDVAGAAPAPDIVVVDSYLLDVSRAEVPRPLVALDDLGRDLDVDLLVDPNPDPPERYRSRCTLGGQRFALVESLPQGTAPRAISERARNVLVTFGAARPDLARSVASRLLDEDGELAVTVAVGPWSGGVGAQARWRELHSARGILEDIAAADVVVTAGGVTALEALSLGRPSVVVETADNQHRAVSGIKGAGAAECLESGPTVEEIVAAAMRLVDSPRAERDALSTRARGWIDGGGASRVAEAVLELA